MRKLIQKTLERLEQGERVLWCVILATGGSTPREAGARMALFSDGSAIGTVGGGAMELEAMKLGRTLLAQGDKAVLRRFDLDQGGGNPTGMVCGGFVELGFLPLAPSLDWIRSLLWELDSGLEDQGDLWLRTELNADGGFGMSLLRENGFHTEGPRLPRQPALERTETAWILTEPVSRDYRVWLFGGGHVGAALAPVLINLGFPVTVCDPREALLEPDRCPGAQLRQLDFHDISREIRIGSRDYVVVMTPGHEMDLLVLRQVLTTEASYIGCIGSRRKTAYVNQKLLEEGWAPAQIQRIHAPIGLPIGAKTPEEIAISIAAEMIRHRAGLDSKRELSMSTQKQDM